MPGIQQVSFTSPYGAEEAEIERRRQMAQLLQQQGQTPLGPTETVGGWAVRRSPLEGLNKAVQQGAGAWQESQATEMAKALRERQQGDRSADMQALAAQLKGAPAQVNAAVDDPAAGQYAPESVTPARPGGQIDPAILGRLRDPQIQQLGTQMWLQQMQSENAPPERVDLGDKIGLVKGGQIVGYLPKGATPDATLREAGSNLRHERPSGSAQLGARTTLDTSVLNPAVVAAKGQIAAQGAPRVTVDNRAESAYGQKVAGGAAERDETQVSAAQSAAENMLKLDSVIDHLKTSKAITGMGSDVLKNVERAKVLFTQSEAAGKKVSDTELLDTMLGSDVFPMIKALGIGARGMDTPAEREFLRSVMTGTTTMNKDTLIRMAEIRRDISKRAIDKYNQRVEKGELDRYFRFSGMPKQKIEVPGAVIPDEPPPGAVRPRR